VTCLLLVITIQCYDVPLYHHALSKCLYFSVDLILVVMFVLCTKPSDAWRDEYKRDMASGLAMEFHAYSAGTCVSLCHWPGELSAHSCLESSTA